MQKNWVNIAGIGASAGGLEALSLLVSKLDPALPCAYVVVQHLSPFHRSMMASLLSRETTLTVIEASSGMIFQPGTIYIVPATHNAVIKDGLLVLIAANPEDVPRPSINTFFMSLAANEEDRAIGIVLSGTGSDGVAGLQAIKAMGGIALAQNPEEAKYTSMPQSAINANAVDHVLDCAGIAEILPELIHASKPEADQEILPLLLDVVNEKLNLDFSGYKSGMLMRRVHRRMLANRVEDLRGYMDFIQNSPDELDSLARDILISVTSFFRDPRAFSALRQKMKEMIAEKVKGEAVRIWIAGCATGEEAYSVSMMLDSILGDDINNYNIQIFATDLDEEALSVARRGVYSATGVRSLPDGYLKRYFVPAGEDWEIKKDVRDRIVFARHNLVSDAPFLRLDLICCRNVLIYFDASLQVTVLNSFHFGLNARGVLFLGKSETTAKAELNFAILDRTERLFEKTNHASLFPKLSVSRDPRPIAPRRDQRADLLLQGVRDFFELTALLCDLNGNIQHTVGDVEEYLTFPSGATRMFIGEVMVPELRSEVLTLYHRFRKNSNVTQSGRVRKFGEKRICLHILPVKVKASELMIILVLPENSANAQTDVEPVLLTADDPQLQAELLSAREHLHTLLEEMAASNEEMQALIEESHASNEELQASYEELESSNEELQAANEELVSLNEEISRKVNELGMLSDEYNQLFDGMPFSVLTFDTTLRLQRFNTSSARQFGLAARNLQMPITSLERRPIVKALERVLLETITHGSHEDTFVHQDGNEYQIEVSRILDRRNEVYLLIVTVIDRTEVVSVQRQLSASEDRLTSVMGSTGVIFAMKALSGEYTYVNPRFIEFFGIETDVAVGLTDFGLFEHELAADIWSSGVAAIRERGTVRTEHRSFDKDGNERTLDAYHRVLLDPTGKPEALMFEATDVTQQKEMAHQQRITGWVFEQAGEAIVVTDPNLTIVNSNSAVERMTGLDRASLVGQPIARLFGDMATAAEMLAIHQALARDGSWKGEMQLQSEGRRYFPGWMSFNRVLDNDGQVEHFVVSFSDVSQLKLTQARATYLSAHDTLTGLPNRGAFQESFGVAIARARENKTRLGLLFLDIDKLKSVNDSFGHTAGDEVLAHVASRLRKLLPAHYFAARIGGDEFAVMVPDLTGNELETIATQVLRELTAGNENVRLPPVGTSIGSAVYPDDEQTLDGLLRAADGAMYHAKALGRNRYQPFTVDLRQRFARDSLLRSSLLTALVDEHFYLHYQPIMDCSGATPKLLKVEALLRWHEPTLGQINPGEFIPLAEKAGLIGELDLWVHSAILTQMKAWRGTEMEQIPISINISPQSLQEANFGQKFLKRNAAAGVSNTLIQIEITENILLDTAGSVTENLSVLSSGGIRLSLDDFGSGYSSLAYLGRLPISEIKVDRAFVKVITAENADLTVTRAILGIARALNLDVVAEGVEKKEELAWLLSEGCEVIQGFLLAQPVAPDRLLDLLKSKELRLREQRHPVVAN